MGLGLRNQVEYPEIKAKVQPGGASAPPESSPGLVLGPGAAVGAGKGSVARRAESHGAGVPWALSRSRQGCAQEPTAAHLVRCACSAAPSAAAGALKGGAGTDERGGRRSQEPAAPPPPAPSPGETAARSTYPVPRAARIRQRLSPARVCCAFRPWPVQELSCTGKRRADERRPRALSILSLHQRPPGPSPLTLSSPTEPGLSSLDDPRLQETVLDTPTPQGLGPASRTLGAVRVSPRSEAEKEIREAALEAGIRRLEGSAGVLLCTITNPPSLSGPPSRPLQGCPSEMVQGTSAGEGAAASDRYGEGQEPAEPTPAGQHPGTSLMAVLQLPVSLTPPFNPLPPAWTLHTHPISAL